MKKKALFLFLLTLLSGSTLLAQVQKGDVFITGLNIISFQTGSLKFSNDFIGTSKSTITEFYYGPSFIYGSMNFNTAPVINIGVAKNLSIGFFMNLNLHSEENADGDKATNTLFAIGPVVRYYLATEKKFQPFAEAKMGFGNTTSKYGDEDKSKSGLFGYYFGSGGTYYFKPKVGLDFMLGYGNLTLKDKDSDYKSKTTLSGFEIGIGMLVGF